MADMILSRLEEKFRLLIKKMQFLQEENMRLERELTEKRNELQKQQDHLQEMEHQIALQKIAVSTMSSDDSAANRSELKRTLNEYIREIDHCIARLNE